MTRLTLALLALFCLLPSARATSLHNIPPLPGKESPSTTLAKITPEVLRKAFVREKEDDDLLITDDTEVLLDGQRCELKNVPAGAVIAELEIAADKKTIRKIAFKSKK